MAWIGKVGGGILGLIVGGPVGALIGSALGHQFDRGAGRAGCLGYDGLNDPVDGVIYSAADRQRLFFQTTFLRPRGARQGRRPRLRGRDRGGARR